MVAEADSLGGATVAWAGPTATDDVDGVVPVVCDSTPGTWYPLGETVITCTAADTAGNVATATFIVEVVDTVPPALQSPGDMTVDATSALGAYVEYVVSAADVADPQPEASCVPPSGTTLPIGTTAVECVATDVSGNTATGCFEVLVQGAAAQIEDLVALAEGYDLQQGIATSLDAKLARASDALDAAMAGDRPTACHQLDAFMNEVRAQAGQKLTEAQAIELLRRAAQIQAVAGCSRTVALLS